MERRASRIAIGFACVGHTYMHVLSALYLTIVLGLGRDWGMDYDRLIGLWTLGSLMIGLGAPLAGWLGDRWSECRMLVVFFLVTGGGAIAAGLAATPTGMLVSLAVLGLGAAIYHPVGMSLVVRNAESRGRALGVLGIFGSVGVASASLVAAFLTDALDWRMAFIIPGAISVATGIAMAAAYGLGWIADRRVDRVPQPKAGQGDVVRAFLVLSVTMVCGGLIYQSIQVAMPKWFETQMAGLVGGGGMLGVGGLVTMVYLMGAFSQFGGGWLADRMPLRTVYIGGLLIQIPILFVLAGLADVPLLVMAALAVFINNILAPAENLLLARYTPDRHRGLAYGAKFILAFGIAPLGVQLVAWTYAWSGGFAMLLMVLAAVGGLAWLASLLLPGRRDAPRPVAVPAE
jgi:MFS family permease